MKANTSISRRTLIKTVAAGVVVGGTWSSGFLWASDIHTPMVEVIGRDESQIVLVDSGVERILVLSGAYDEMLMSGFSDMMGSMRRRVDVLFATESSLSAGTISLREKWRISSVLALPEIETPVSPLAELAVIEPVLLSLSEGVNVRCIPHHRYATSPLGTDPGWRIEVQRGDQTIVVAPNLDVLSAFSDYSYAMAIAPTGSMTLAERKKVASAYALNDRSIESLEVKSILTRIFESDVARFELGTDSIRLPRWSTTPNALSGS